ncbi:regulatory protein RecX [Patulibacter defluvii]|uniref:regulatory protein RecX n=1 Tax=Patulibacter defluvii TaxID=3095358 RepID=UPI002A749560|nr:regulatory protein RecX [Patulibacter sp. DM4]
MSLAADPDPDPDLAPVAGERPARERPLTASSGPEERVHHALDLAYRHLAKRDRTVAEVQRHLERRQVGAPTIERALAELHDLGYLDDRRYAQRYVEDRRRIEGWGRLRIAAGLRRMGIGDALIEAALAGDPDQEREPDLAVEALEQRLGGAPLADDKGRSRALRLLATRGFPLETAYDAVRTYERRCRERADG